MDVGIRQRLTARFGSGVQPWLDSLPDMLATLASRWQFSLGPAIPRGSMSAVFHCRLLDGRPAVVKISPDRARVSVEAAALRNWQTTHAPALLAADEQLGAILLEAIAPSTPLVVSSVYPPLDNIASLLRCLHESGAPDPAYPSVGKRVDHLFDSSLVLYERHPHLATVVPLSLYESGRRLATRLAQDVPSIVLLHGDLTPSNILDGGAERGLVAIDPAPCLGDAAFDAVDLVMWQAEDVSTVEDRIAALTGLEASRLLAWCCAFAAMNALELASQGAGGATLQALLSLASRSIHLMR